MTNKIKIWGHRGCKGVKPNGRHNPPENSLASFQEAINQKADGFELDVFLTTDKELVVFHDDTLERMTNGAGNITENSLQQLKELRLKNHKGEPTELSIPTLEEVLDLAEKEVKRNPDFTVNIEIKGLGIASHVAEAIKQRLANGWKRDNFQVSSFDMASLREMRTALPELPIGALLEGPIPPVEPWDIGEELLAKRLGEIADIKPDTVNITLPSMTPKAVEMIKSIGAKPVAWTSGEVNPLLQTDGGRTKAEQIIKSNLHAMITDFPEEIRSVIEVKDVSKGPSPEKPHSLRMLVNEICRMIGIGR